MSMLARSNTILRIVARSARASRTYSSSSTAGSYSERQAAATAHAEATTDLWRKISFYVCIPTIVVGGVYVWGLEKEHGEHLDHLIEKNGGVFPHAEYDYLHKRSKPFPWGLNVLFFNPKFNKDMESE